MLIKAKYKIARRLGYPVFEKTQTAKYALSLTKRGERTRKHARTFTDFGKQLLEKQKVRYTYLTNERQLKNYVTAVLNKRGVKQDDMLFSVLESRLDNTVYRLGFAPTRLAARQFVTHGHFCVNGKRLDIPSYSVKEGDKITIRTGSATKKMFANLDERLKEFAAPKWLALDANKKEGTVTGAPKLEEGSGLDWNTVLEFYKR